MSAPVTLAAMRLAAQQHAHMENSAFVSTPEWNSYINYGCSKFYNAACDADVEEYRTTATYNTVGGVSDYGLPVNFYRLRSVDVSNGNDTVTARKFMEYERNLYKNYPYWATGWPVRYRRLGQNLRFIPTPSSTYAITLNYYPTLTNLVNDSDTFDGINGNEEIAIFWAVAMALEKQESDSSFWIGRYDSLLANFRQEMSLRDMGEPERAQDVYAVTSGWRR